MSRRALLFLVPFIFAFSPGHARAEGKCIAPAKTIAAQVNDLCFLQFETDDIAHPGVVACDVALSGLPDTCESRVALKTFRCHLLQKSGTLNKEVTIDQCIRSVATEGLLGRGCEYPFEEECAKRMKK